MNFSYNWLRALVPDLDTTPASLTALITIKTAECEGVEPWAPHLDSVCAALVESAEPIEGSRNRKAVVDTGRYGRKTVVCGAPNCRPGIVTAFVPPGTALGGREIRTATISGVESEGMLASGAELGLNRDNDGIIELTLAPGASLGIPSDWVIEVDNKSLTHRPDLWGHYGMAREVSAITGKPLRDPVDMSVLPEGPGAITVQVNEPELCPRYSALVFENVTVGPSPLWLQARLEAIGLNPISNIVDVTNFVMAELAQPMHAFDADKLTGGITVRRAGPGERMAALNNEEYTLGPDNLVIADDAGAVALAGVIGGRDSAIGSATTRIILESANFDAASVRKTSSALRLRTDASMRFEKAQDPLNTTRALARAITLLREVSPGIRLVGGVADIAAQERLHRPVRLPLDWLDRKIGRHVDTEEVRSILTALQFVVEEPEPRVFSVTVPSWRATKDVSIKDDLVEEIGRMIGYASIPPKAPLVSATVPPVNEARLFGHNLRKQLAAQGYDEVCNYSFVNENTLVRFGLDPDAHVRVLNPIASDQTHLRSTLIPGIWKNIGDNARYFGTFRIYEIGAAISAQPGAKPNETPRLTAAIYHRDDSSQGLFELKRLAEFLSRDLRTEPTQTVAVYEHPVRTANLILGGTPVGRLFEFHPSFVERGRAAVLDIDLEAVIQEARGGTGRYQPIRRFPSSAFDLSVVVPARTHAGQLEATMKTFAGAELESIAYVREYTGPQVPQGTKSVSFRVTVAAADRTLASEEVGAIRQRIIDGMQAAGYDLRV